MAKNTNLGAAKAAKNDEFYTQYADIQKEINAYLEYNPDTFRDKTVLLPCDDPEWSNFTKFFAQSFERLGLKRLIITSYAVESKKYNPCLKRRALTMMLIKLESKEKSLNSRTILIRMGVLTSMIWSGTILKVMAISEVKRFANLETRQISS